MKRLAIRGVIAIVALLLVTYVGDYCSLRFQIPGGRPQYDQIEVQTLYAIPLKDGKTEYEMGQPETDRCVHSLFPHYGSLPCWYVTRHRERRIDI